MSVARRVGGTLSEASCVHAAWVVLVILADHATTYSYVALRYLKWDREFRVAQQGCNPDLLAVNLSVRYELA